jgi:hypothetical protein
MRAGKIQVVRVRCHGYGHQLNQTYSTTVFVPLVNCTHLLGNWLLTILLGSGVSLRLSFTVCLDPDMAEDVVTSNYTHTNNAPATPSSPCRQRWWMRLFLDSAPCPIPHVDVPLHEFKRKRHSPPERSNPTRTDFSLNCNPRSSFLLGLSDRHRLLPLPATSQHRNCGPRGFCICTLARSDAVCTLCRWVALLLTFLSVQRYIRECHFPCNPCTPRQG